MHITSTYLKSTPNHLRAQGTTAIFSVTNFWEHLFTGLTASESGTAEATQAFTVATAAAKTPTLQHFLFSTLPSASELSAGAHPVPHMDYKAAVDDRIRVELPELAEKTTFIWLGWYSSNMVSMPLIRPTEWGGKYLWIQPSRADALLPVSGDLSVNLGVFTVAALEHPEKTKGRYVNVRSEVLTFEQILGVWGEVAGREAVYVPVSKEVFERVWGPAGEEMALQYEFGEACGDWESMKKGEVCQPGEIGVTKDQLVDLRGHLMGLKARLL